jgi:hypothetical protein
MRTKTLYYDRIAQEDAMNYGRQRPRASAPDPMVEPLGFKDYAVGWVIILVVAFLAIAAISLLGLDAVDMIDLAPGLSEGIEEHRGL